MKKENEYNDGILGHISIPYSEKLENVFFRKTKSTKYSLHKNGILLEKTTRLPKWFLETYLIPIGYIVKPEIKYVLTPKTHINGIPIKITKNMKDKKIIELTITINSESNFDLMKQTESFINFIKKDNEIKITNNIWTKMERC